MITDLRFVFGDVGSGAFPIELGDALRPLEIASKSLPNEEALERKKGIYTK